MKIVFATHNENKLKEVKSMLPEHFEILSLTDIGCNEDIKEYGETVEANAFIKARYVKENYGYNCFADDTGLEIQALNGAPGVYSARYAGKEKDAEANMQKVLKKLNNIPNRKARFITVIALCIDEEEDFFTGICNGEITQKKQGNKGFGYDPIFQPLGYKKTFAQMDMETKNKISHRAKAFQQLVEYFSK